jgi:hypothetical protein
MDANFIPIETVPARAPFGLDQLRRSYKTSLSAEDAIAAAPDVGDADDSYSSMFLMTNNTSEAGDSATRIDLIYWGSLSGVLPDAKHSLDRSVATATTYTSSAIFPLVADVPASVQYYQPASSILVISTDSTSAEVCPDPDAIVIGDLITWTLAAEQPASSFPDIAAWILANAFVQNIVETTSAEEIVPGEYWQVSKRKTMNLFPYAPPS